jgi:heterodisulfide reductase subunit B
MTKLAYFPGCSLLSTGREYDASVRGIAADLGLELTDLPDWNCCGASSAITVDHDLGLALCARDLSQAEALGLDLLVPCAACYNRLKTAQAELEASEPVRARMAETVGAPVQASGRVLNLLEALADIVGLSGLKQRVTRPLASLRPAAYYGCLLLRPPDICQFDDAEAPTSMDRILEALGAAPVTWYQKTECCGAALATARPELVEHLCARIADRARQAGANCLVTACPLCHMNLDSRQPKDREPLPAFYLTQLIGLALGKPSRELQMQRHLIDAGPLLRAVEAPAGAGLKEPASPPA